MGTTRYGQEKRRIFIITLGLGFLLVTSGYAQDMIGEGTRVSLEYTLTLEDQTVIDTNVGKDPLVYTHGSPGDHSGPGETINRPQGRGYEECRSCARRGIWRG